MDASSRSTGWRSRVPGRFHLLKGGLKVLLSAALFLWLLRSGNIELSAFREVPRHTYFLALAFLFLGAWFLVAAARLQVLLSACEIRLPYLHVLRLFAMGEFFSLFFLGSVGGDLSRVLLLGANSPRKPALAALIVLIDKVTVLWAVCAVSLVALTRNPLLPVRSWSFSVSAFLAGVALGWPVLLLLLRHSSRLIRRPREVRLFSALQSALEEAGSIPASAILKNAALSVLGLGLIVLNFMSCALALGVTGIPA
ncbi:MAG: hypothetical protein FJW35_16070, partial [Acidobacteria bacterium]|nr:hypothetical protein [Acidobacteriota bacterium]